MRSVLATKVLSRCQQHATKRWIGAAAAASVSPSWSHSMSFASPESDFSASDRFVESESSSSSVQQQSDNALENLFLLSSSPDSALGTCHSFEMLDDSLKAKALGLVADHQGLPKTMSEALVDQRPIVITSLASPFTVVNVNTAWVDLCEYSRDEAVNKPLGELLQGPDTSSSMARSMVAQLRREGHGEAVLTNYTKSGRSFQNHITVSPLSSDDGSMKYFVGILEDIQTRGMSMTH